MTISQLLRTQPTVSQYDIMSRADRMFAKSVGRYFGGQLTTDQVRQLTDGVEIRQSLKDQIYALPVDDARDEVVECDFCQWLGIRADAGFKSDEDPEYDVADGCPECGGALRGVDPVIAHAFKTTREDVR